MGAVYLVRELAPDRMVAMKFLRAAGSQSAFDRFLIEVRSLATLDHPHIIRVLATDFFRFDPFFTTEYLPNGSLLKKLEESGPLDPVEAVRLIATVARAVHAANENGVVHRDLKPSNILVADDGTPRVADFGLAKRLDRDDELTMTLDALGSPPYMAPEQTGKLKSAAIDARTDVYGLGSTLYHLVTGRKPFAGGRPEDVMAQVVSDPPRPPCSIRREVTRKLEAIILKAMEKNPARRYSSGEALAQDLDRFLAGLVPEAPLLTWLRRAGQRLRRNRLAAVGAGLLVTAGLAIIVLAIVLPQDPLKKMRKDIAAGRAISVVGESGTMNYPYRWQLGPTALGRASDGTEVCAFESIHDSLLELVSDPFTDRYEVSADFRIVAPRRDPGLDAAGSGTDRVGLYFGYDRRVGAGGRVTHTMLAVSSNDYRAQGHPLERSARLETLLFTASPDLLHTRDSAHFAFVHYEGVDTLPGKWRKISIKVTPEEVRAHWDGQEFAAASAETIREKYSKMQAKVDNRIPDSGILVGAWSPKMPLGIHCHECAIKVQNFVLKPLPPKK